MIGYVYLTVNDANNKIYIGKRQKPYFDKKYKGSGKHLKLALKKYGEDKFHAMILEKCDTTASLCNAEKKWIKHYKEMGFELYNIAEGGEGGNLGATWRSLPEEKSSEILEKNRQAHIGKKNPFYGKHHTEKTKAILREKNKNKVRPLQLKAYKEKQRAELPPILQIDKNTNEIIKIWNNWCEANEQINPNNRCGYSHISECCKHKRKTAYGYKWKFAETEWRL